jgi:hypothetical protein
MAAGHGWFAGLGARWPNMLPLYDFKHPRIPHTRGEARTSQHDPAKLIPLRRQKSCVMTRSQTLQAGFEDIRIWSVEPTEGNGGACRDRTDDLKLAKLPLSQLS